MLFRRRRTRLRVRYGKHTRGRALHYEPGTRSVDEMVERSLRPTLRVPRMTMREQVESDRRERALFEQVERGRG